MKKSTSALCAGFAVALALITSPASARPMFNYFANLDGLQEVPPNASPATGFGTFGIDTDANTMTIHIEYSGLTAAQNNQHIHGFAAPGASASPVFTLPAGGSPINAVWNFTEAQQQSILDGLTYANIHTTNFPGGEIRGQIVPEPATLGLISIGAIGVRRRRRV